MTDLWTMLTVRIGGRLLKAAVFCAAILVLLAFGAPALFGAAATAIDPAAALLPPGPDHWLGTDELGRDVLIRTLVATRLSLGLALSATMAGALLGILAGALPSILGRRTGRLITAAIDLMLAFPALLLALFVSAVLGASALSAILAIALAIAPVFARLTYTLAASIVSADHVAAARLLGVSSFAILRRHILPMIAGPLLVTVVMTISGALVVLSGLSFLGLGVQSPSYDWGLLLAQGLNRIYLSPATSLAPAGAIVLTGLMFMIIGEAVSLATGVRRSRAAPTSPRQQIATAIDPDDKDLLRTRQLSIGFGGDRAVNDVSLAMAPGERVGLVGESGSGKTLTASACALLPIEGAHVEARQLHFCGRDIGGTSDSAELRRFLGCNMAFIFQDPLGSFNPVMRIGPQLAELAQEHLGMPRDDALARARQRLREAGLRDPDQGANSYPHEMSGGMLQRSMIGLGLMATPKLLIADEPTTALDVTIQARVLDLIDRVCTQTGAGLLLISHDLGVIAQSCDRVLVMYAGRIVEELPVDLLASTAAHPYTRALAAAVIPLDADKGRPLPALRGAPPVPGATTGCAFAPRCDSATALCGDRRPDLSRLGAGHKVACWHPRLSGQPS